MITQKGNQYAHPCGRKAHPARAQSLSLSQDLFLRHSGRFLSGVCKNAILWTPVLIAYAHMDMVGP